MYYRIQCEGFADVIVKSFNYKYERRAEEDEWSELVLYLVLYKKKFIQKDGYFIKYDQYELNEAKATSDSTVIDLTQYTKQLTQEATEATYERVLRSKYRSYPNPVQDKMTVEIKDSMPHPFKVKVFDLNGKLVFEEELTEALTKIDLSAIKAGTYFVRIDNDKGALHEVCEDVRNGSD